MHTPFIMPRQPTPARHLKIVKRCESVFKHFQCGATCIVCSTGSTIVLRYAVFSAINWLYKWLESLKLSLVLQLAKFRN